MGIESTAKATGRCWTAATPTLLDRSLIPMESTNTPTPVLTELTTMEVKRPPGFEVYSSGYGRLFDRAVKVFGSDHRVRGMWLHGAFARGAADRASDLDIDIAIADEHFDEFVGTWRDWLAAITPTVSAVPLTPGSFYALTPGCERIDVISEKVSALPASGLTRRVAVFDWDGLSASLPPVSDPEPDPERIRYLITETLRQAANFETVTVRDDWLLGVVAVQSVHLSLYQLFAEANLPQAPTGPKQWSVKLSTGHRAMLEALPVPQPDRQSVMTAREAALALFLAEAPAIAAANDVEWPNDLADAVLNFLDRQGLGITCPLREATR